MPLGLTAVPGNAQTTLNWTAVTGATSYNLKRATLSGGPYAAIASRIVVTNYTDTGLDNNRLYYVVSALNAAGESANSAEVAAIPGGVAVNCGGSAAGWFGADAYASGGTASSTTSTIDLSGVTSPAPQAVCQTDRYGNCTYTITGLTVSATWVRLHFAETYWTAAGKWVFNVSINGASVLNNFEMFAAAGAQNRAIIREFHALANGSGQMVIQFTTVTDNANVNGIEVLQPKPLVPSGTPGRGGQRASDAALARLRRRHQLQCLSRIHEWRTLHADSHSRRGHGNLLC